MTKNKRTLLILGVLQFVLCACSHLTSPLPFYDPERSPDNVNLVIKNSSPFLPVLVRTFADGDRCTIDGMQSIFRGGRPEGAVPPKVYRETRAPVGKTLTLSYFAVNSCQGLSSFTPKAGYEYSVDVVVYSKCILEVHRQKKSADGRIIESVKEETLRTREVQVAAVHDGSMCVPEQPKN